MFIGEARQANMGWESFSERSRLDLPFSISQLGAMEDRMGGSCGESAHPLES